MATFDKIPEGRTVKIYVNGRQIVVPKSLEGPWAVRGALGCPRGWNVAIEGDNEPCLFQHGYIFDAGERFIFIEGETFCLVDNEDGGNNEPWSKSPDWWKRL